MRRILRSRTHRKLIHIDAPKKNRTLRTQLSNCRSIIRRSIPLKNLRAATARLPLNIQHILNRNRHTKQTPALTSTTCRISQPRLLQRTILIHRNIRTNISISLSNFSDNTTHKLLRTTLTTRQCIQCPMHS